MSFLFLRGLAARRLYARFYATPSVSPSPSAASPLLRRFLLATSLGAAYTLGSLYPPSIATYISPRAAPPPPDPNTAKSIAYTAALEAQLHSLPLLQHLRSQQDASDWYEARPYTEYPEKLRVNHFTAGTLKGPGKLALNPLIRAKKDETEAWVFLHVGRGLCGHDGIIHGGLMATLLDESLARMAFFNLPARIGVTANLSVNYRAPTNADQFIVIKTYLSEQKGRKAIVVARVEDLNGNLLQDATAVFVQPKYANLLNSQSMAKAAGKPIDNIGDNTSVVPSSVGRSEADLIKN